MSEKQLLKSWDQDKIIRAVAAIMKGKWGLRRLKNYLIFPRHLLGRMSTRGTNTPEEAALAKLGRRPEFSKDMEQVLLGYLLAMAQKYFGLVGQDVRMMAFQIAKKNEK